MLDSLFQTVVLRAAARQRDAVGRARLLRHDEAALCNCHLDARGDLVGRLALTDKGDDLGLGKNGALSRDGDDVLRVEGELGELKEG